MGLRYTPRIPRRPHPPLTLHHSTTLLPPPATPALSATGAEVTVNGGRALNLVSQNFLGIAGDAGVAAAARGTIDRYGVGSCGPRGFYGTIDVHLELEARLAALMGREEAILYSYDLATLPSIIPAFASKADIILMDEVGGAEGLDFILWGVGWGGGRMVDGGCAWG